MIPILIVEDEFLVRVGLRSIIEWEKYGFSVVADASSAEKGLELYEKYRPYLIITDIRMWPMDGLAMIHKIRETDQDVHFIIISAYSEFEYAQKAILYGVDLYLDKADFTAEDLEQTLQKICREYNKTNSVYSSDISKTNRLPELPPQLPKSEISNIKLPRAVAVCRLDESNHQNTSSNILSAILSETLNKDSISHSLYYHNGFIAAILHNSDPQKTQTGMAKACATMEKYTNTVACFGISENITSENDFCNAVESACQKCGDMLAGQLAENSIQKNRYIDDIIKYVNENLQEDLSLNFLAKKFHISASYLGKLFYKKTGAYLSAYVNNCRINKACELISGTDYSIGEIGRFVGIENPHYFSKLFKDKMGISPQQFKLQGKNR